MIVIFCCRQNIIINSSVYTQYRDSAERMIELEIEKEAEMFHSMVASSESETPDDEMQPAECEDDVDTFFAVEIGASVSTETASSTDKEQILRGSPRRGGGKHTAQIRQECCRMLSKRVN